ncbi:MAG: hypothetical protein HZA48_01635 [Planctomycetes bacterium]|nr:hypothetical protein [Planctomycetota bacterium]
MKTNFPITAVYFCLAICIAALNCSCLRPQAEFFPEIAGWASEPTRKYIAENLYEHIDGAAELFIKNNFQKAYSKTYSRGDIHVTADIYIHNTAGDAVTVFSSAKTERSVIDNAIGEEAIVSQYQIIFRQGNCYVDVQTGAMNPEAGAMVRALSEKISMNIDFIANNSACVSAEE